jgi:hypothetical protein
LSRPGTTYFTNTGEGPASYSDRTTRAVLDVSEDGGAQLDLTKVHAHGACRFGHAVSSGAGQKGVAGQGIDVAATGGKWLPWRGATQEEVLEKGDGVRDVDAVVVIDVGALQAGDP